MNATTRTEGAPVQAAHAASASAAFDPTYVSSNGEAQLKGAGHAVTVNGEDQSVKLAQEKKVSGAGPNTQFRGASVAAAATPTRDGMDYLVTVDQVVGNRMKAGGFTQEDSTGARGRYRVSLPHDALGTDPTTVNPFDPQTIPRGGSVTLDGQHFTGTALEGRFRNIAIQSQATEAQGASYRVDHLQDGRVRVTTGPNQAVEAFNGVGFAAGKLAAVAGRQDALGQSTVRTATFDLDQVDGRAAYQHFIDTGVMDAHTPGVQDLATVERLGMSSQTRLKAGVGDAFAVDLAGQRNTGDVVRVRHEDGSFTEQRTVEYSGNVPVSRFSAHGADGQEDISQRRYQFQIDLRDHEHGQQIAGMMNAALTGNAAGDRGPLHAGVENALVLDEPQMRTLMERTQAMVRDNPMLGPDWRLLAEDEQGNAQTDVDAFAAGLARNQGHSAYGLGERLFRVASAEGRELQPIDASVQSQALRDLPPPSPLLPQHDPRNQASPRHGLWLQTQGAVNSLDQAMGRQPDQASERLGMALLVAATHKGLERVDQAVLSDDGRYAFAVQGEPHAADRQIARADTAQAIATPVAEHVRELQQVPERAATEVQATQQREQEQLQQQDAARSLAR